MLSDDEGYTSSFIKILDKESSKIAEDLEVQVSNSKRAFHQEELCGWAVTLSDLNRFRWINNRKSPRTSTKDQRTNISPSRLSFSRQSVRNGIELEFQHFPNGMSYIEQYRGEKMKRHEAELNEYLSRNCSRRSSETFENCSRNLEPVITEKARAPVIIREARSKRSKVSVSPLIVITSSRSTPSQQMNSKGRKLYGRPMAYIRTTTQPTTTRKDASWNNAVLSDVTVELSQTRSSTSTPHQVTSPSPTGKESWAVIGTEKKPLPPNKKSTESHTNTSKSRSPVRNTNTFNSTRRQSSIPLNNSWVKTREQELNQLYSESFKSSPRSYSAPNIGSNTGRHDWQSKTDSLRASTSEVRARASPPSQGGAQNCSTSVDYSCYTEMFRNVLEYYGTNRLRPNAKTQASTTSSTLLSIPT